MLQEASKDIFRGSLNILTELHAVASARAYGGKGCRWDQQLEYDQEREVSHKFSSDGFDPF